MLDQMICSAIEATLNHTIEYQQPSDALNSLRGRSVAIAFRHTPFQCYLVFGQQQLHVYPELDGEIDVTLNASPLALMRLAFEPAQALQASGDIDIKGNPQLLQACQQVLLTPAIDWRECLAMIVGDGLTHQIDQGLRQAGDSLAQFAHTIMSNTSEYLQEEARIVAPVEAVRDWCDDVDECQMAVDRLTARIAKLQEAE